MTEQTHNNDNSSAEKKNTPKFFNDLAISISQNTSLKITGIITAVIIISSATWTLGQNNARSTEQELSITKEKLEDINSSKEKLDKQYSKLQKNFDELKKQEKIPMLISPVAGKRITGQHVSFKWKYDVNPGFQNFILELKHISQEDGLLSRRYQIPQPYKKNMEFQFPDDVSGEFFWRIGTGELLENYEQESHDSIVQQAVSKSLGRSETSSVPMKTELWSRYGNFQIYGTALEKIKATEEMVVGITNTFLSYDHVIDCSGKPNTYDMDFIEWITEQLRIKLADPENEAKAKITLIRKTLDWSNLFDNVALGEVDLAIANITKSKSREKTYHGLKFTDGYRENQQRIIFSKTHNKDLQNIKSLNALTEAVNGSIIATQNGTINMDVAHYLKHLEDGELFNFKQINNNYNSYFEVIDAIERGEIKFGMIDSIRLETVDYPDIGAINIDLTHLLKDYYKKNSDYTNGEEYAIAVSTGGKITPFLRMLNIIINSPEGILKREQLEKKHNVKNKRRVLFKC